MINVEQVMQQHLPNLQQRPWLAKPLTGALKQLLHEDDFQQFARQYPHLQGVEFVEQVLDYFQFRFAVRDDELERIPVTGRVVIIANHPIGSLDGLALIKLVSSIRSDVKVVANQLLNAINPLADLLLPVNNLQGGTEKRKLDHIRDHLQQEGALILFPAGEVSRLKPNGVRDGKWHGGFLRFARAAKAPILPVFIDAKNSALFYGASMVYKPLATMLLVQEMFKQKHKKIGIRIGELIPYSSYSKVELEPAALIKLFKKHLYRLGKDKSALFKTEAAIAHPEDRMALKKAIMACQHLGETSDGKQIYLYQHQQSSALLREIGRLREHSFRAVGEGTGMRRDLDKYDGYYQQLLLWDAQELELVGAYRFADSGKVIAESGIKGLYTASLFHYADEMLPLLHQGLELGRSFVQPKYWGKRSLDYLWCGIGAYLKLNPQIRYLFGGVSISNHYPKAARDMLVYFYSLYFAKEDGRAQANNPYQLDYETLNQLSELFHGNDYSEDFVQLKCLLATMGLTVPTLYKQYSELTEAGGVEFLAFGIDPEFANCLDGLVFVDLTKLKAQKRQRYLG
jgi:putative hemolysin